MNRDGEVKAYFVDSFGFTDVTEEFLERFYERPEEISEAAFQIEDRYLEIHETDGGYDYSIYSDHYKLIDGGRYESDVDLMKAAKDIVQDLREPVFNSETGTYTRLPVQGNINANSRMRRISFEGSVIEGGNLDFVKALAVHPLAREALELIREAFPEYRFVAPAEIKESFYPEHMTTEELAGALMDLAKEFDAYEFMDQAENPEDSLMEIKYNLLAGNGMLEYAAFLKDVKEESRELAPKAEALLGKLKEYSPELKEEIQPMVKIQFSQNPEFKEGSMVPLAEADERVRAADERQADFNASHQGEARVLIVSYEIIYAEENQMKKVAGTAFIGDGRGGILGNLQQEVEEHLNNQTWLDYKKGQGADNFQSYIAELRDTQEHALPYLQQFISLEERGSAAIAEESTKTAPSGKESKAVTQTKTAKGKLMDEAPKKSIHARLQEKKKEIAKKPGKDSLQRGVELA